MMSTAGPLSGVGMTALGVARLRAGESRRPDRLFDDPLAAAFVNAVPDAFPEDTSVDDRLSALLFHGVIRTRFFDDYLLAATAHGCRQVLLLAAGLDTRAFRLDWPSGTRLIELDLPEVMTFKDTILTEQAATPRCERIVLPADLCGHWSRELTRAGFRRSEPTAWLAEGLLLYLSAHEVDRLLTTVTDLSSDGSRLALDDGVTADNVALDQAKTWPLMQRYAALWKGGLGSDTPNWLDRHGWSATIHDRGTVAAAYGRHAPVPGIGSLVTAQRTAGVGSDGL